MILPTTFDAWRFDGQSGRNTWSVREMKWKRARLVIQSVPTETNAIT